MGQCYKTTHHQHRATLISTTRIRTVLAPHQTMERNNSDTGVQYSIPSGPRWNLHCFQAIHKLTLNDLMMLGNPFIQQIQTWPLQQQSPPSCAWWWHPPPHPALMVASGLQPCLAPPVGEEKTPWANMTKKAPHISGNTMRMHAYKLINSAEDNVIPNSPKYLYYFHWDIVVPERTFSEGSSSTTLGGLLYYRKQTHKLPMNTVCHTEAHCVPYPKQGPKLQGEGLNNGKRRAAPVCGSKRCSQTMTAPFPVSTDHYIYGTGSEQDKRKYLHLHLTKICYVS